MSQGANISMQGALLRRHALPAAVAALALPSVLAIGTVQAGLRGPGKYSGVVVFDRWDTCLLLSGPYITYISEKVKEPLRQYQGIAMQVDASDVFQPMNPGDALIRKFEILGPAPKTRDWIILDGLKLTAEPDFGASGAPTFLMNIENDRGTPIEVFPQEIGPALLGARLRQSSIFAPSDGKSVAVVTRTDPSAGCSGSLGWRSTEDGVTLSASYTFDPPCLKAGPIRVGPLQSIKVRITFKIYPGQFQFILGYGGGVHEDQSLASNAVSFDLDEEGRATLAP